MKRFYCTVCKRTVRVYRLPDGVELTQGPKGPIYSNGVCRHHGSTQPRTVVQCRVRTRPLGRPTPARVVTPPPAAPAKGKRLSA